MLYYALYKFVCNAKCATRPTTRSIAKPRRTRPLTDRSSGRVRMAPGDYHGHGPDDYRLPRFFGHVHGFPGLADHCVETVHRVGRVVDCADGAVGLDQAVLAADHVAGPFLRLVFDVARGRVVHAVLVRVAGRRLLDVFQ